MTSKTLMTRTMTAAREIKAMTDCDTDELRAALTEMMPTLMGDRTDDFTVHLGGNDWRFIASDDIDAIMADELRDAYVSADGYGPHFGHYDGDEHEIQCEGYYAFNCG